MTEPWRSLVACMIVLLLGVGAAVGYSRLGIFRRGQARGAFQHWLGVHAPHATVTCVEAGALEPMLCNVTHPHFAVPVLVTCQGERCSVQSCR